MAHKTAPYNWLNKIDEAIYQQDQIPLIAGFYPLDLNSLSETLSSFFQIENLTIELAETTWLDKEEIKKGFSNQIAIDLTPLPHPAFLLINEQEIKKFTSWAVSSSSSSKSLGSKGLYEGFFQFLLLKTLNYLDETGFFGDLSPKLIEGTLPENALCFDFKIKKEKSVLWTRLVLSTPFRHNWNAHFSKLSPISFSRDLAQVIDATLSLKIGSVFLSQTEFNTVSKGDFISLDKITYDPNTKKGFLIISLSNVPLFHAKIKESRIKILDYTLYNEVTTPMHNEENFEEGEETLQKVDTVAEKKPISLQDVPFEITVEIAKISMPLSQLKELQPGNFLELPVIPEQGVNLTINGNVIGKGELVFLGERLGVRVLELGKKSK